MEEAVSGLVCQMKRIDVEIQRQPQISLEERIQKIAKYSIFCLLSPASINQLALLMEEVHVQTNEVIVREGDYFDGFFLIVAGTAAVTKSLKRIQKTNPKHIVNLGSEQAIGLGEAGYFSQHGMRSSTVTALSPMILLHIDLFNFYHFLSEHGTAYPALKKTSEKFLLQYIIHENPLLASSLTKYQEPPTLIKKCPETKEKEPQDKVFLLPEKMELNISPQEQMIFTQINAKNSLVDILKNEFNELNADEVHLVKIKLKKLGLYDLDILTGQINPRPIPIFKKLVRKIVHYWKGKTPRENNE